MAVDITMKVFDKELLTEKADILKEANIKGIRNSDWFCELMGRGHKKEYDELLELQLSYKALLPLEEKYQEYYSHSGYTIADFMGWFREYSPEVCAGFVSKYDAWLYERKGIVPNNVYEIAPEEDGSGWTFLEYLNKYEPSIIIYQSVSSLLAEGRIHKDDILFYCFDC